MTKRMVWMAGPAQNAPGGISAVVASYDAAGLFAEVPVQYISTYMFPGVVSQLREFGGAFLRFAPALLCRQVRLLHVHSASRGSFWRKSVLCAAAKLAGVPYVFHLHSGEFAEFFLYEAGLLGRWWIRRTLQGAHTVVVLTKGWAQQLQSLVGSLPCVVVPNPVVLPAVAPLARGRRRQLLFLGRIRQKKGAFDLLRAFPAVLAAVPSARLVMAGDGDIDTAMALCSQLGVVDQVQFTGWVDGAEKAAAMDAADVFVLPSYYEGLPMGILEAMAAGLVVVASPVGGIPDVLTDGVDGRLVTAGNVPALATAIIELLNNVAAADGLVAHAWQRVQAHDSAIVAEMLVALYERIAPKD